MSYIHYHQVIPNTTIPNGWSGDWIKPNDFYPYPPIQPILPPTTTTTTTACWPPAKKKGRTVYTGGTFDVFHVGHVKFLEQCANIAGEDGEVVVSLNTDEFITEYKGTSPIYSYEDRERILMSCVYVDRVIPNSGGADSKPAILSVNPDFIVIGSDWAKRDYYAQMGFTQGWLYDNEISLIYVPYTEGISTTEVKASIRKQING